MVNSPADKNPAWSEFSSDWTLMRDAYRGQRAVKTKTTAYLPATANQLADGYGTPGSPGQAAYDSYLLRARFPNFVREAVQMAIGMMHSQPPQIELPESMKNIRSTKDETLPQLLRRINTEQLITGRLGLLADMPVKAEIGKDIPWIATYSTERLINWDDGGSGETLPQTLNLVVLDECEEVRGEGLSWSKADKYRVLILGDLEPNETEGKYRYGIFDEETGFDVNDSSMSMKSPSHRGRKLNKIPFVIINSSDLTADPDEPPLLDLGNLCMTIYRGEADYRQNLYMQGQDTFVTVGYLKGDDEVTRVGAGVSIDLPMGGDAKYVGVTSDGLAEQRSSLENDRLAAGSMGAQTMDTTSRERESGESLHVRMAARTADLNQIALAGAQGLENVLRIVAEWIGEDPDSVKVTPNLEFGDNRLTGQSMVEMSAARNAGFPVSARTLHKQMFDKGMTELTFEEEMVEAEKDKDTPFARALTADVNTDQKKKKEEEDKTDPKDDPEDE